jgi:hypothetical protein
MVLAIVAIGLLGVAALATVLMVFAFQYLGQIRGMRYLVALIGAAAAVLGYYIFVRVVERRTEIEELSAPGALKEMSLGFCGGLALSFATSAILSALGAFNVISINSPLVMASPFVLQFCTAVIVVIFVSGLGFRLVERLLGSWLTLLLTVCFFGAVRMLDQNATSVTMVAVGLQAGLLFAVLYMVTRRLWAPIGLYAAWKFAQIAFDGNTLTASGPHGFFVSLLNGPDWLTGGPTGTATSVPAVVLTAITLLILLTITVRRGRLVRPFWQRGGMARHRRQRIAA